MVLQYAHVVLLLLATCWLQALAFRLWATHKTIAKLLSGLLFGASAVIGMLSAIELEPGLIFDARSVLLGVAGLFGGPLAAAIATGIAGGYRLWVGGIGLAAGMVNIVGPALLGLIFFYARQHQWVRVGVWQLLVFGLLLQLIETLALYFLLPSEISARVMQVVVPTMWLFLTPTTILLGIILLALERFIQTEIELGVTRSRLLSIVSAMPDLTFVLDEDGRYLDILSSEQALLSAPSEQLIGRRVHEVLPTPLAEQLTQFISQTLASDTTQQIKYQLQTQDGITRIFEGRAHRIQQSYDLKPAIVLVTQDVTARVKNELQQRISAIAFESQFGMMICDKNHRIIQVNQSFIHVFGYSADEVVGQHTRMLSSGRHQPEFYQDMWRSIKEEGIWQGEIWNRRKTGEVFPERLSISAVLAEDGEATHYVGAFTDISKSKADEDTIKHLAFYDALTGLPNRQLLLNRLQQTIISNARTARHCALLFLDMDNFKNINELYGHDVGDAVLQQVAERITNLVRRHDTVSHVGGDEFVVLLEELGCDKLEAATQVDRVAEKILRVLEQPYELKGIRLHSSVSIGVVLFSGEPPPDMEDLLKHVELSMYQAKSEGKNTLRFFDPQMHEQVMSRLLIEDELRRGITAGEFVPFIQPQVDKNGCIGSGEVLIRWQHPERGLQSPGSFIPIAEQAGLIGLLDFMMLEKACDLLVDWARQPALAGLSLAVNLSAHQLYQAGFVKRVLDLLERSGANPLRLKLELTESVLINDMQGAAVCMSELKAHGIRFSIDDFGTGYSSMSYLQNLPLSQLKIDQSFVRNLPADKSSEAIVRAICSLGASLGLEVIAEGVEQQSQRAELLSCGCHNFQGYLFGRPMPADEFQQLVIASSAATAVSGRRRN
jgi:diguanylate cyclase (GGDEF)-like protein/PAS domain S-box-containing protein